ncbi:MAG: PASTA domain-containing protein [Acidimicrobiales bacterium]
MPNLVGLQESTAQSTATNLGLEVRIINQSHNTGFHPTPPHTVISQRPLAGAVVHSGQKVILVVEEALLPRHPNSDVNVTPPHNAHAPR